MRCGLLIGVRHEHAISLRVSPIMGNSFLVIYLRWSIEWFGVVFVYTNAIVTFQAATFQPAFKQSDSYVLTFLRVILHLHVSVTIHKMAVLVCTSGVVRYKSVVRDMPA